MKEEVNPPLPAHPLNPTPSVQVKMRVAERERIQPEAVLSLVNSIYLTARESCSDLASSMKIQSTKLHSSTDRELMLKLSSLKGVKLSCLPGNRSDTDLARVARSSPPHTLPPFQPPACRVQGGLLL